MRKAPLGVVADDITGAMDVASILCALGVKVSVFPEFVPDRAPEGLRSIVVSCSVRHASFDEASRKIYDFTKKLLRLCENVYLKVDSTLRGSVGAITYGFLRAIGGGKVVFCPANPHAKRTVSGGSLLVDGTPLHLTSFATDPLSPMRTSSIVEILESSGFSGDLSDVVIADAETERDLERIARMDCRGFVGSSGLVGPLARKLGITNPARVLFIVGSLNPVSAEQVKVWRQFGFKSLSVDPEEIGSLNVEPDESVVIYTGEKRLVGREEGVASAIAEAVKSKVDLSEWDGVFLCGGEIASRVLEVLGNPQMDVVGFIETGIPLTKAGRLFVVTKPGGFGSRDILVKVQAVISSLFPRGQKPLDGS